MKPYVCCFDAYASPSPLPTLVPWPSPPADLALSQALLAESNGHKTEANGHFAAGRIPAALTSYAAALAACPDYLSYELAVLHANAAACHLKLAAWPDAIASASAALAHLDGAARAEPAAVAEAERHPQPDEDEAEDEAEVEAEIVSAGAAQDLERPRPRPRPLDHVERLRAKALLRRARARGEAGGWARLEGALEDYRRLDGAGPAAALSPADRRRVRAQLESLPARAKAAQEAETAEMWGKLKDLGNGILRPFGMSTDSFKMVKDEATGGYSLNFQGGGK